MYVLNVPHSVKNVTTKVNVQSVKPTTEIPVLTVTVSVTTMLYLIFKLVLNALQLA